MMGHREPDNTAIVASFLFVAIVFFVGLFTLAGGFGAAQ